MRQRAASSDIVIVNHHLLFADAAVRQNAFGEVIPACNNAILDEAHQLEDVATQHFGCTVSNYRVENLARNVDRSAGTGDDLATEQVLARLRDQARAFFSELALAQKRNDCNRGEERVRMTPSSLAPVADAAVLVIGALDGLQACLVLSARPRGSMDQADGESAQEREALARRAGELCDDIRFLLRASDTDYVYFVEFHGRGVFLRALPIDVSAIVRELLLDRMRTTVLTSATLTVAGTFDYVRRRRGIGRVK